MTYFLANDNDIKGSHKTLAEWVFEYFEKAVITVLRLVVFYNHEKVEREKSLPLRSNSNQVEVRLVKSIITIPSYVPICKVFCSANMKVCWFFPTTYYLLSK